MSWQSWFDLYRGYIWSTTWLRMQHHPTFLAEVNKSMCFVETSYVTPPLCLGLTEVPTGIPDDVVHIDLSHNSISHLKARDFQGARSLRTLNVSSNSMEHMDTGVCTIITAALWVTVSEYCSYVFGVCSNVQDGNPHMHCLCFYWWIDNIWRAKRMRACYTTTADFCLPNSWRSAIFCVYSEAERPTDTQWSSCWNDSYPHILTNSIALLEFFVVSTMSLNIIMQEGKEQMNAMHLSVLSPRFPVRAPASPWAGPVKQQTAFHPVWGPGRFVLPVSIKAGRKPVGVWL